MSKEPDAKQVMKTATNRKESAISLENNEVYIEERRKFIDKFTLCDVVCKTYIENYAKTQKTSADRKKIKRELDMRIIPNAFKKFDVHIDNRILTNVFGAEKKKGSRSCKKIRDGIVHAMRQSELEELHERYSELMNYMDEFLKNFVDEEKEG